MTNTPYLFCIS